MALCLFVSAALLFLFQPMIGKVVLPRFGGAPAVWVVLARREADRTPIVSAPGWMKLSGRPDRRVWSDDYSNVFDALRWQGWPTK